MKRIIYVIIGIVLFAFLFTLVSGYSMVIPLGTAENKEVVDCLNDKINPFEKMDFTEGDWKIYVTLSKTDKANLPSDIKKVNCLKTSDRSILNSIKEKWTFKCDGSDLATVDSGVYLIKDGQIVFTSGLAITSTQQGLQNERFGWISSNEDVISNALKEFDRVYFPVIFL